MEGITLTMMLLLQNYNDNCTILVIITKLNKGSHILFSGDSKIPGDRMMDSKK